MAFNHLYHETVFFFLKYILWFLITKIWNYCSYCYAYKIFFIKYKHAKLILTL